MALSKMAVFFVFVFIIGCSKIGVTGEVVKEEVPVEVNGEMGVYFCPRDDCEGVLIDVVNSSIKSVHCAFFDIDLKELIKVIGAKSHDAEVKLVVDNENYGEIKGPGVRKDNSNQYSHNKFCVIDGKIVTTGSMNPTENDANRNNNNLIVIYSKYLAENYEDEFKELWNGDFGEGEKAKYPVLYLNNHEIENYFCPEDSCTDRIAEEINLAEKSIYFMAFSFTSEEIADAMLFNDKADIEGLFEKMGSGSEYSQYKRLRDFGLRVRLDNSSYVMHHKVFIIDNRTVITGSMNPSGSGNWRNDENILIIHDKDVADKYLEEFERLY